MGGERSAMGCQGSASARPQRNISRTLKLVALGYVVKTALFGLAWLAVPDLPQRTMGLAQAAWAWVAGTPASAAAAAAASPR